jgi:hypothetical protein
MSVSDRQYRFKVEDSIFLICFMTHSFISYSVLACIFRNWSLDLTEARQSNTCAQHGKKYQIFVLYKFHLLRYAAT